MGFRDRLRFNPNSATNEVCNTSEPQFSLFVKSEFVVKWIKWKVYIKGLAQLLTPSKCTINDSN